MKTKFFVIALFIGLVSLFSCTEENTPEEELEAPEIPPESSMIMDFSSFNGQNKRGSAGITFQNYKYSVLNVGFWNTIITSGLAIPVASFVHAIDQQAVYQGDKTWVWSYTFNLTGQQYSANLYGTLGDDNILWEMQISNTNFYENFTWFTGETKLDGNSGTWTLMKSPNEPYDLLLIEWSQEEGAEVAEIKYKNVEEGNPEKGGYIMYAIDEILDLDAFYDIYNKGLDNHTEIEWNRTNKNGRVKDPKHFSDEEWHCWDESQQDIECE